MVQKQDCCNELLQRGKKLLEMREGYKKFQLTNFKCKGNFIK